MPKSQICIKIYIIFNILYNFYEKTVDDCVSPAAKRQKGAGGSRGKRRNSAGSLISAAGAFHFGTIIYNGRNCYFKREFAMTVTSWTNDFVALLVIIDPVGLVPIFLSLTIGMTKADRQQTALIASCISFAIIAVFVLGGTEVLAAMGISLDAFRVAGGILLFYIAFEMIFGKAPERRAKTAEIAVSRDHIRNIAAFPLAMPLIAGPGTLSASILMATKHSGFSGLLISMIIVAVAVFICYFFMLLATPIERLIGDTGRSIVAKLFGILLSAMAVQFVAGGLRALLFS